MAGYVTKLVGYVYDGDNKAGEALTNGIFAEITADGVKKITATKDVLLRLQEKTELWGKPALVLNVTVTGEDEVYFVENEFDVNDNEEYNEADYTIAKDAFVRMKRLIAGEQVIMTVGSTLYAALAVGDIVNPANGGTVAKYVAESPNPTGNV